MLKHLKDIEPVLTSHGVGTKRVLLAASETDSSITQIAVTSLSQGEEATAHKHDSMEEYFFFLKGDARMSVDGEEVLCRQGDFVRVECGSIHVLTALTDIEVITIGVAL